MYISNNPLKSAIIMYLLFIMIILILKPKTFYNDEGELKKTTFPIWMFFIFLAIVSYYLMVIIKIVY